VALCQARISTKPLWGFSSSNPYPTQSRAEHLLSLSVLSLSTKRAIVRLFATYTTYIKQTDFRPRLFNLAVLK
jgi:hypothetical protein